MIEKTSLPIEVYLRKTPELIHLAECTMACSGSVSLELLYHKKPTVVLYWISPLAYRVQEFFRRVKYITLVNLLTAKELFPADTTPYDPADVDADRVLFPEYLTCQDKSLAIAGHLVRWLADDRAREELVAELAKLKARVGHGGASQTSAELILQEIKRQNRIAPPKPHLRPGMTVVSSGGAESAVARHQVSSDRRAA
jgi:lipid-A-disaccharide synthase